MSRFSSLSLFVLLLAAGGASASSFVATTDTLGSALAGSAESSTDLSSSLRDSKLVLAARDDAASFVASAGAIRGAQLQAAFEHIRRHAPQLQASDRELAEAILAR